MHRPEIGFSILAMNTPHIYDFVIGKLGETKGRWSEVSRGSGVSKRTLEKIARKEIKNPGIRHVQALADFFQKAA